MTAPAPAVLRTAAVWGTTVLAAQELRQGQSLELGDGPQALVAKPDGTALADAPVRAVGGGWELDARGATGGIVVLRGRREDPVELGRTGAPIPVVAGDHGVVQYGSFSVFFQFTPAAPAMARRTRVEWALLLAFLFSSVLAGGVLLLLVTLGNPPPLPKPLELTTAAELAVTFGLDVPPEPPPQPSTGDAASGSGVKDPGAKDKKEQGGGKKIAGAEGALGKQGQADETKLPGEVRGGLGGMSDVLASDVGDEVRATLGSIGSVAAALGGLNSDSIVLGRGSGTGLKGTGPGGGGDGPGVPFGSGTLDTGWGPGTGGGYGTGSGGPGGKGSGGPGGGGKGGGEGEGGGERKVTGKDAPATGQGLSPNQIARVVQSRYGAFRACYESAASRNPTLQGSVGVSFSIAPGGNVSGVNVSGSIGDARVTGCVKRQFERLSFPPADKPTNASWSFVFKPSKK